VSNKRLVIGLAVGVAVFAATFGMAASLGGLTADDLGAEDAIVASCENVVTTDAAPNVTYTTAYNTTGTAGYKVATVVIEELDDACDGSAISVTLAGASGASLLEFSGVVPTDVSTTVTLNVADTALAESVQGVHVLVTD
jgi:hypothetical protein